MSSNVPADMVSEGQVTIPFDLIVVSSLNQKGRRRGAKGCGGLLKSHGAGRFGEVGGAASPLLESTAFSTGFVFWLRFSSRERQWRSRENVAR